MEFEIYHKLGTVTFYNLRQDKCRASGKKVSTKYGQMDR